MSAPLSRRRLLQVAGGVGAAAAAGFAIPWLASSAQTGRLLRSELPLPEPFTVALPVLPVLTPKRIGAADHYEIVHRATTVELLPGVPTEIWGYDGRFPGPTIVSRSGRPTVVTHRNQLPVPTAVHLHGGHVPAASDGYPTDLIMPEGHPESGHHAGHADPLATVTVGSRVYEYPIRQRAATLWYHDHRMDFTGPAVWRGLAGFHLIRDDEEEALPLPSGDREIPLMITDRSFAADGSLQYPSLDPGLQGEPGVRPQFRQGVMGDVVLVNGAPWPVLQVAAVRYRFRVLNASNTRRYRIALDPPPPGGSGLVQIGSDGGLLERPLTHDAVEVAPAERFDLVVDFSRYRVGQSVTLVNQLGSGTTGRIMRFQVARVSRDDSAVPSRLSAIEPLHRSQASVTREFVFRAGRRREVEHHWTINNRLFDPARADATVRLGDVEIWRLTTDFHHPVHLHLVHFQVLRRNIEPAGPHDAGWKDTVDLRPSESVEVIARFADHRGRFAFHCHNLEHEDMAMMGNLRVV
jgi:spore coat protein A